MKGIYHDFFSFFHFLSKNYLGILFAIIHLGKYNGRHPWYLEFLDYVGYYTGDGLWGSVSGVIGAGLGIAAGQSLVYDTFRKLYIAQSVFVS